MAVHACHAGYVYLIKQIFDFLQVKNKIGSESCPQELWGR
jgi:hypothetical protein